MRRKSYTPHADLMAYDNAAKRAARQAVEWYGGCEEHPEAEVLAEFRVNKYWRGWSCYCSVCDADCGEVDTED